MRYDIEVDDKDIDRRKEKIRYAFLCRKIETENEFPVIISTPNYFVFGADNRPGYFENPEAMLAFQTNGCQWHLKHIDDDYVPFFMPWYGTGVLASAFGCKIRVMNDGGDPAVAGPCFNTKEEAAKIKMPDPNRDGWMPKVLDCIEFARTHSNIPIGPTDLNSPLCTLMQLCGYDKAFLWMYDEPTLIHYLMGTITDAFIDWVKIQKDYIGEPLVSSNGLQGVWSPDGIGVWVSDDDLVSINPELYEEFVVPYYSKIFSEFGGGSLHYCGKGTHQTENFKKIEHLKAINNSPMGQFDVFANLAEKRPKGVVLQIQDSLPDTYDTYFEKLFEKVPNLNGMLLATWVLDHFAATETGGYVKVDWNTEEAANSAVKAVRKAVRNKLEQIQQ